MGSRPTNGVSRCFDHGFVFPTSNYPSYDRYASPSVSSPCDVLLIRLQTDNHLFRKTLLSVEGTTLNTTTESPLVSSQTCRSSSVVGAPPGRHSRLGPALSAFNSLNDLILLSHDWLDGIYFRRAMLCENAHSAIFRIVPNDLTVLPDDYRDEDLGLISEQSL
jgi:hypothetical protein